MADIFDQLLSQQSPSPAQQPPTQSPPVPSSGTVGGGDIFDQLISQQAHPPQAGVPSIPPEREFGEIRTGEIPVSEVLSGAIENLPGSVQQLVKTTVKPFTSVENFTNAAKSIGTLAEGLIRYAVPGGDDPSEKAVEAVGQMYADRFGGLENIKRTIRDDPAGFMADLSFFLGTGGALVSEVAGTGTVGRAAAVVSKVGKALDPLRIAGAVISTPIKLVGKLGKEVLGRMLTGKGPDAIQKAFDRPPDFVKALKGDISMEDVLRDAKGGLQTLKDDRSAAYTKELAKIKTATKAISISDIKARMVTKLKDNFRWEGGFKPDGTLDLSGSVFPDVVQRDVQRIYDLVQNWDSVPGRTTPLGLDTLKRRLDDFFAPSKNSRSFVTGLRNEVKNKLTSNVRNYRKMTKDYSEASDILNRIEKGLSLGDRGSMDTAIRKLTSVMKGDNKFREGLLQKLELAADTDFRAQIAGVAMQDLLPSGLVGRLLDVGVASNILYKGIMTTEPQMFAALLATSPRTVAAFLNVLGKGYRGTSKAFEAVSSVTPPAFQLSRAGLRAEESQQPVLE